MISRKIRVVQLITRLIKGGAQKVCLDIVEYLPNDRYEIYLIAGPDTGPEGSLWERAKGIKGLNIKVVAEMVREISPLKDMVALMKLCCLFKTVKPDIVHCHTSKAGFVGCVAAKLAGVPVIIYSPHGHLFAPQANIADVSGNILRLKLFYFLRRLASFCATKVIALNNADKNEQVTLLKLAPARKYEVIYNGIEMISPKSEISRQGTLKEGASRDPVGTGRNPKLENSYPLLATVGRLTPEKGHSYLLEAVKLVKNKYPNVLLLVIGDGILRNRLESISVELGIKDNVRFTGLQDNPPDLVKEVDLFILPSLYEAFGLVLLEAMTLRKAVIASKVNGIPEVVVDNETGILVPPAQSTAIAEAIIKLAKNKEMSEKMGAAGYKRVSELFVREKMVSKFDKLYQQVLK